MHRMGTDMVRRRRLRFDRRHRRHGSSLYLDRRATQTTVAPRGKPGRANSTFPITRFDTALERFHWTECPERGTRRRHPERLSKSSKPYVVKFVMWCSRGDGLQLPGRLTWERHIMFAVSGTISTSLQPKRDKTCQPNSHDAASASTGAENYVVQPTLDVPSPNRNARPPPHNRLGHIRSRSLPMGQPTRTRLMSMQTVISM